MDLTTSIQSCAGNYGCRSQLWNRSKELKSLLIIDSMIACKMQILKRATGTDTYVKKAASYKISMQKKITFIPTINEKLEIEMKKNLVEHEKF